MAREAKTVDVRKLVEELGEARRDVSVLEGDEKFIKQNLKDTRLRVRKLETAIRVAATKASNTTNPALERRKAKLAAEQAEVAKLEKAEKDKQKAFEGLDLDSILTPTKLRTPRKAKTETAPAAVAAPTVVAAPKPFATPKPSPVAAK